MNLSPLFTSCWSLKRGGWALAALLMAVSCGQRCLHAQPRQVAHSLESAHDPPGVLGFKRRIAGGDIGSDYFQAVRIILPEGAVVGPASAAGDERPTRRAVFGLNVGHPYRFVVKNIRLLEDLPLYPSIELIDRTYPPPGMETRFPIPIELSYEDLKQAAEGNYVERIVYVEDPDFALPIATERQRVLDVDDHEDPLTVAKSLGRPVAVVRLGSKAPDPNGADDEFLFGSPAVQYFDGNRERPPVQRESVSLEPPAATNSESLALDNLRRRMDK